RPDDARVISLRDAADRASRITSSDEAERLMNVADQNGDHVLVKALARECAQRANPLAETGYSVLFHQWVAQQPGGADTVSELGVIADEQSSHNLGHRMSREQAFSTGAVMPADLRGIGNLRALAAEADAEDAPAAPADSGAGSAALRGMAR
ncbi:MAG: hypothetical protein ACRDQU_12590, partial [Pseudonocardiaceae bacterium]